MANKYTDKEILTKEEYYQLIGLLTLGKEYEKRLEDVVKLVSNIVGENDIYGHSSDAVYNGHSVDELLNRLNIKVENNIDRKAL